LHAVLYVLLPKRKANTSAGARIMVSNWFIRKTRRLYCDWFVIGGRWSGMVPVVRLPQRKVKAYTKELQQNKYYQSQGLSEQQRNVKIQQCFKRYFPNFSGEAPDIRDTYQTFGYDDDAMLVDDTIYRRLVKAKFSQNMSGALDGGLVVSTNRLKKKAATPSNIIDRYWIVPVDFHY